MAPFTLAILATFLGLCIHAIIRQRRALAEDQRVHALAESALTTRIADAPPSGLVRFSGRATGRTVITAPFTGGDALWARASLHTNIGQTVKAWTERVEEILVDDDSGCTARVRLEGGNMRFPEESVGGKGHDERIQAYRQVQGWGRDTSSDTSYFEYESALRPGDYVDVIGTLRPKEVGYREGGAGEAVLSAAEGELVISSSLWEESSPTRHQQGASCAVAGAVVLAAIILIVAFVTYWP